MNRLTAAIFRALFRAARPWSLVAGILLYALGGGIAVYLGNTIQWTTYWAGQAAVTMLQLSAYFLREYFDRATQPPFEPISARRPPDPTLEKKAGEEAPETVEVIIPRVIFLQVAAATLTIGAALTVVLVAAHKLNPVALLFLGLAFLLSLAYAVPPFRLVYTGYGELVLAILLANLFPALAYLLQIGDLHRLLAMLTFPLTFLMLAAMLARSLQRYMEDVRQNRQTMLVRVGWQRGMALHNALVALAYVVLAISVVAGLPGRLALPAFLSLPAGVFQIWQINSIANGARPRWQILSYTALASIGLMAYFLNLALWTG